MKSIGQVIKEIINESPERWILEHSRNWHSLILTSEGNLYWSEGVDQNTIPIGVWEGEDRRILVVNGAPYDGPPENVYELIPVVDSEFITKLDGAGEECPCIDGETYKKGDAYYGYDREQWYQVGGLLSFSDACPDMTAEEHMQSAIEEAQCFWSERGCCLEAS